MNMYKNFIILFVLSGLYHWCNAQVTMKPLDPTDRSGNFVIIENKTNLGNFTYSISDINNQTIVQIDEPTSSKQKIVSANRVKVDSMKNRATELSKMIPPNIPIDVTLPKNDNAYLLYQFAYELFPPEWDKNKLPKPSILRMAKYITAAQKRPWAKMILAAGAGLAGIGLLESTMSKQTKMYLAAAAIAGSTTFGTTNFILKRMYPTGQYHPPKIIQNIVLPIYYTITGPPQIWHTKLESLTKNNILDGSMFIGGKEYFLSAKFNNTVSAGYTRIGEPETDIGTKWQHYEIYIIPDNEHLIDLFADINGWAQELDPAIKEHIAFIALRPTPDVYTTSNPLTRQVLPRIIICLKPMPADQTLQNYKEFTQSLIKNLYIQFSKTFNHMRESGYHPRYSEKLTPYIFVGFGGQNYKDIKEHQNLFERNQTWYGTSAPTDMAYHKGNWHKEQLGPWPFIEKSIKLKPTETEETPITPIHGLLVFLDDSEKKLGAISGDCLAALQQNAGPIIASASIIDTIRNRFNEQLWIIKEINPLLYLLIPKSYLLDKNISEHDLYYTNNPALTEIEYQLGLKANHMQMVTLQDIKRPLETPQYADYFMQALWDETQNKSHIFVTHNEYAHDKIFKVPQWVIYIGGHGGMKTSVVDLSLEQFKTLLSFLEYKIQTYLLYYSSCYAAGINSELLYKDTRSKIDKTYSFAIITQALTDASIFSATQISLVARAIAMSGSFFDFLQYATTSHTINYNTLANLVHPNIQAVAIPQIKLPGLPWFSVIDTEKVASIGTILTKTRTEPLDIETFFAKKGKLAEPIALLLYANYILFELIINSKTDKGKPPSIISMIPGTTAHRIKKISSSKHSIEDILSSFLDIESLGPNKYFSIWTITGICSSWISNALTCDINTNQTIEHVVISLIEKEKEVYFSYNQKHYLFTIVDGKKIIRQLKESETDAYNAIVLTIERILMDIPEPILTPKAIANMKESVERKKREGFKYHN